MYLHYVLDLWADWWRRRHARGDMIIVRFADDFIAGFEHLEDARQFLADLRDRFARFCLELHPDKTRLIEFGPVRGPGPGGAGRREAGDVRFPGIHGTSARRPGRDVSGSGGSRTRSGCGQS